MLEETKLKSTVIYPSWNVIKVNMSSSVMDIWVSVSIHTVTLRCVKDMVNTLYNKYRALLKSYKRDKNKIHFI